MENNKILENGVSILINVLFIVIFLTIFFFTFISRLEKEIVETQLKYLVDNSFNFIPKAIYIKFENVIDQDSDYLNSDGYFFDGILNLNSQYNFEYNHEIENTFQYILNSPLKRKIKQSKIIISF